MNLHIDQIPRTVQERSQWVGFKVERDRKTPCIADAPQIPASSTDRETWRSYGTAATGLRRSCYNAIAYALNGDFIGVDLDNCFDGGQMNAFAEEALARCASYAERSISGNGVHILLEGPLPEGRGHRVKGVELYDRARFLITTGDRLPNYPEQIKANPAAIEWLLSRIVTETTETTENIEAISSLSAVSVTSSVEDIIQKTLPKQAGERHARVFDLARGLRLNAGMADCPLPDLKVIVHRWYETVLPVIRTKEFTETWSDFIHAWSRARVPLGQDVLSVAWTQSRISPPPDVATQYDVEPVRQLVCLCTVLAQSSPDGRFFLSSHAAARLVNVKPMQVSRWMTMLIADGLLEKTQAGNERRATRYRWTAPLAEKK